MFSDVLSDSYYDILDAIDPEYSYENIYTPNEVIKMLAKILYVIVLSDGLNADGTFSKGKGARIFSSKKRRLGYL